MTATPTFSSPFVRAEYPIMQTARRKPKHIRKQEEAARQRLIRLEQQAKARAEARQVMEGVAETVALAEARGETVQRQASGAVRVDDRDPLLRLLRLNHLTTEQYDAGRTITSWYEARSEGIGSTLGADGGTAHDNDRYVFNGLQRAKKLQRLGALERRIALDCRDEPACLQMLRAVCGEGKSLSSQSTGSRGFDRHLKALCRALDVAKEAR